MVKNSGDLVTLYPVVAWPQLHGTESPTSPVSSLQFATGPHTSLLSLVLFKLLVLLLLPQAASIYLNCVAPPVDVCTGDTWLRCIVGAH